ncbi:reprolysin-like metallopeptidase [Nonlabens xiamenensis]|uniref:reprolysin-like metallopeptidase n=1 Tax=Nonlabens xiamenensis TaxID=2341043 RepID=UPI000F613361|nr:zinc-dependent metalloprotease family protein [Nonlabens xiamenensis]
MNRFYLFLIGALFAISSTAQTIWLAPEAGLTDKVSHQSRFKTPNDIEVYDVNPQALSNKLVNAVDRFADGAQGIPVDFPVGSGKFETFKVYTSGAVSPGLQAKYPNIQSYFGHSVNNALNKMYFTITPKGFHGLLTGEQIQYMDPLSKSQSNTIVIYNRRNLHRSPDDDFQCHVMDVVDDNTARAFEEQDFSKAFEDRFFRRYRIAIAATAEYTAYHDDGDNSNGNAVADALAGIIVTLTRVNSVYEQEMSMQFELIPNNDQVIYTNPNTDPYDNYSGSAMLGQNVTTLQNQIGSSNYDIGHVFSTGGGGIAGVSPCGTGKERGVTGIVTPEFDPFDIDYVCHEIGHQYGADHTFYNGCFGGSPSPQPYETGSASTIMGYAGICAPNVQDNSDAYFHLISLFQMQGSIDGDNCDTQVSLGSNNPTAPNSVGLTNRTVPRSTPFKLTGVSDIAPDPGEVYTYNWEQLDVAADNAVGNTQPPVSTNTDGPLFRSKFATTDPTRYFPNLPDLVNNIDPTWETLPSVGRGMRFFCTIRDNNPNGGQTSYAGVTLTVGSAGPFEVNAPSGGEIWHEGETQTITWNVNGTNNSTYSTTVNILLSQDGGLTYPITLASGVNNDGSQAVTLPVGAKTTQARIMVEAENNYFFDITNADFEIKEGTFELTTTDIAVNTCQPADADFDFTYNAAPGFNETVTFNAIGLPAGLTAVFTPATANADTLVDVVISGTGAVEAGQYDITVEAVATSATITQDFVFKIFDNEVGKVVQTSPINGAGNQVANPLLQWENLASASGYLVEVSEFSDFSVILESANIQTETEYQPSNLTHSKIYYWRVTPSNGCVGGTLSSISAFQTSQDVCNTYDQEYFENNDNVWETNVNAVSARVFVPDDIEITELSFYMRATHGDTGHIKMQLSAPSGRFSEVYNRECAAGQNFDLIVSDSGTQSFGCNPGYTGPLTGVQRPGQAFSRFNGLSAQGEWVLLATDRTSGTGGTFHEFSVDVCGRLQYVNNITNPVNIGKTLPFNTSSTINDADLSVSQEGFNDANLTYIVTKNVFHGELQLSGADLDLGDSFTQDDLNNNRITYTHTSLELVNTDDFGFTVLGDSQTIMEGGEFQINIEDPILTYDAGSWTPFAPNLETAGLDAQVLSGVAVMGTDALINNLSIQGSMSRLDVDANLEVLGNLSVDGLLDAKDGSLQLNGVGAQSISGTGAIEVHDLSLADTADLSFTVLTEIYGVLDPGAANLSTGNMMTFKSNDTNTGQLADASAATINGSFNVESYIPARRAFRFVASSVNTSTSIYDNWQEGGSNAPGLGTHITGPSAADGFDVTSSGNYSLFGFDNNNQSWFSPGNTNMTNLQVGEPYRLMVRGDRTVDITVNNPPATPTTLRTTGTVHQGTFSQSFSTINEEFVMLANPYQAVVDMTQVVADAGTTGLNSNFLYIFDPTLNVRGGYTTIDLTVGDGFSVPLSAANKYLQPGQSLFMATTGAASVRFEEAYKAIDQDRLNVFSTPQQTYSILVSLQDVNAMTNLDQFYIRFQSGANNAVDQEDAIKFANQDETMSIQVGADRLSIERRDIPTAGESSFVHMTRMRSNDYVLNLQLNLPTDISATLVDQLTNARVQLTQGTNSYAFQLIAGVNNEDRFRIEYDNVTLSEPDQSLADSLNLYPNPTQDGTIYIASDQLEGETVKLTLFNAMGQRIFASSVEFSGLQTIHLGNDLSSGMYLLQVVGASSQKATIPLIIK